MDYSNFKSDDNLDTRIMRLVCGREKVSDRLMKTALRLNST
jgi:hypothetical protein